MVVSLSQWSSCWQFSSKVVSSQWHCPYGEAERKNLLLIITKPQEVNYAYVISGEEKLQLPARLEMLA